MIAFRPEFLSTEDGGTRNSLPSTVVDIFYSGSIGRVRVKLANDKVIVVKTALTLSRGENITISISPKNVLMYPYPSEGLEKELALE